eukprot:2568164-Pyramimonas_sp.AAC.3
MTRSCGSASDPVTQNNYARDPSPYALKSCYDPLETLLSRHIVIGVRVSYGYGVYASCGYMLTAAAYGVHVYGALHLSSPVAAV